MILWEDLDNLRRKKKAELDGQLFSIGEEEKCLKERLRTIEEEIRIQEEYSHKLEVQLKEKQDAISNLKSSIAGMEKTSKNQ